MSIGSRIEWTDATWSPTTGCDRVSAGCDHCYALTMAARLKGMGNPKYQNDGDPRTSGPGFGVTTHPDVLGLPLRWRKPRRVFVNSMSDLFHPRVPEGFIGAVFDVMFRASQHTFQVLTKRPARMRSLLSRWATEGMITTTFDASNRPLGDVTCTAPLWTPPPNVWLGTSVEDQKQADRRIPLLLETPAAVRFISAEPLLGPVDLDWVDGTCVLAPDWVGGPSGGSGAPHPLLDWVIVGGESGSNARPMRLEWARVLVKQCQDAGVPVFMKQIGIVAAGGGKGGDMDAWPEDLRVREFPEVRS